MVRLGWERGMMLHNILILVGYLLIGLAMLFGFPTSVALPALLALPLGLFQIWYMSRIGAGSKPNWQVLGWLAVLVFGVTTYLLTFSFWTR
jgi:1,4-dihydroxy-2-naphthoate octaprenyltransferase